MKSKIDEAIDAIVAAYNWAQESIHNYEYWESEQWDPILAAIAKAKEVGAQALRAARAEALEEAAKLAEWNDWNHWVEVDGQPKPVDAADAIRKLKQSGTERKV